MDGMKIRLTRIVSFASGRMAVGILLFSLAFGIPGFVYAQDTAGSPAASQPGSGATGIPDVKAANTKAPAAILNAGAITDVKVTTEDGKAIVTVLTDRLLAPNEFMVENPPRLVLDFPNTLNKVQFTRLKVNAASVKRLRVQQFQGLPQMIARIVFDLEDDFVSHQVTFDKTSVKIVFTPAQFKSGTLPDQPAVKPSFAQAENGPQDPVAQTAPAPAKPEPVAAPVAAQAEKTAQASSKKSDAPPAVTAAAPARKPSQTEAAPAAKKSAPPAAGPTAAQTHPQTKSAAAADAAQAHKTPPAAPARTAAPSSESKTAPAAGNSKPAAAELTEKVPMPTASLPVIQPVRVLPRTEQAEISAELAAKDNAQPQLVAALGKPSISVPPKTLLSPASRFSGQPLTLDLVDIPLVDFFRLMAEEGGINIVMDPEIKGRISIKVVKLPWDQIFDAALINNGLDKQVDGSLVRIARKSTLQEEAKQQEMLKKANLLAADLETRVKRLNYAKADAFLKTLVDQKTVRGTVVVDERTNSLVLTDIPASLNKLIQLIETLDVPQAQVEIEARIVSATRDFARDIGVQFGFVQGNLQRVTIGGPNTSGTIGGTRPSNTPSSTFAAGNPYTGRGASESTSSDTAAISTGVGINNKGNLNVNLPAAKAFGGLGISIGNIFDTFLLDAAITAGETKGLAKLISQPKVTAQNNAPAVITQGLRFPVQTVANNTVSIQFQNAALTLTVTPQITYEGNIVLDLKVENNSPDFSRQVNGVPSIRTSESTTRILVSDGGTTVIGGILVDEEANSENRIPGLGALPIVGNLFRNTSVSRTTQEVLFFVTPRIVK